jgi:hypothetical protein
MESAIALSIACIVSHPDNTIRKDKKKITTIFFFNINLGSFFTLGVSFCYHPIADVSPDGLHLAGVLDVAGDNARYDAFCLALHHLASHSCTSSDDANIDPFPILSNGHNNLHNVSYDILEEERENILAVRSGLLAG